MEQIERRNNISIDDTQKVLVVAEPNEKKKILEILLILKMYEKVLNQRFVNKTHTQNFWILSPLS